jgi:hypothetical protein
LTQCPAQSKSSPAKDAINGRCFGRPREDHRASNGSSAAARGQQGTAAWQQASATIDILIAGPDDRDQGWPHNASSEVENDQRIDQHGPEKHEPAMPQANMQGSDPKRQHDYVMDHVKGVEGRGDKPRLAKQLPTRRS